MFKSVASKYQSLIGVSNDVKYQISNIMSEGRKCISCFRLAKIRWFYDMNCILYQAFANHDACNSFHILLDIL